MYADTTTQDKWLIRLDECCRTAGIMRKCITPEQKQNAHDILQNLTGPACLTISVTCRDEVFVEAVNGDYITGITVAKDYIEFFVEDDGVVLDLQLDLDVATTVNKWNQAWVSQEDSMSDTAPNTEINDSDDIDESVEIHVLRNIVKTARKELDGFCEAPFDGSLLTGIKALSTRCASSEQELARYRKIESTLSKETRASNWTSEAISELETLSKKYGIEVVSLDQYLKIEALLDAALDAIENMQELSSTRAQAFTDFQTMVMNDNTTHGPAMEVVRARRVVHALNKLTSGGSVS